MPLIKRSGSKLPGHRVGVMLVGTLLLVVLVMVPFVLVNVLTDLFGSAESGIYPLSDLPKSAAAPTRSELHVAIVALDEARQLATLRVSGTHFCEPACSWNDQIVFFGLRPGEANREGLPPSASVVLAATGMEITQTIQLPVRGQALRYPFDTYELQLGVVLQRVFPDGTVQTLTPTEAAGHLYLTVQGLLPRQTMVPPVQLEPLSVHAPTDPFEYLYAASLTISRPLYVQVMAVLLVLLVTTAAAFAVFMRPLNELVVSSGALVLGVWGIRQILIPSSVSYTTAVDLSLSIVIIFLLGAISVRALLFFHSRSGQRFSEE